MRRAAARVVIALLTGLVSLGALVPVSARALSSPLPEDYVLFGVSCPSARTCTAAGIVTPPTGEQSRTVIETGTAGP